MAYGYSPVIPLQQDKEDGFYVLTKTIAQNTKQNFKNLLLTSPGERVMIPDFGVGIRRALFENLSFQLKNEISSRIEAQAEKYMPFLAVNEVEFLDSENSPEEMLENTLAIRVFYSLPGQGIEDVITVSREII